MENQEENHDVLEGIVCHECFAHISTEGYGECTLCGDCELEAEEKDK